MQANLYLLNVTLTKVRLVAGVLALVVLSELCAREQHLQFQYQTRARAGDSKRVSILPECWVCPLTLA
jgi:hypothetical protein